MSVLTEFFVASPDELPSRFPGWLPVRPEPSPCEVVNPFTGKKSVVMRWVPATAPTVGTGAESGAPDLENGGPRCAPNSRPLHDRDRRSADWPPTFFVRTETFRNFFGRSSPLSRSASYFELGCVGCGPTGAWREGCK